VKRPSEVVRTLDGHVVIRDRDDPKGLLICLSHDEATDLKDALDHVLGSDAAVAVKEITFDE
jgi:hypothetical protein